MENRPNILVLLSQALVAFIIECDNEAEHRIPHRTAAEKAKEKGPWLTSMAMYSNCLQHLPEEGLTVRELEERARTQTNLGGMHRWGYVSVDPKPTTLGSKGIGPKSFLKPTKAGLRSKDIWPSIPGEIEERWRERFGSREIDRLRELLWEIVRFVRPDFPDCLPILSVALTTSEEKWGNNPFSQSPSEAPNDLPLHTLLARGLLAFAVEFESESKVSLAICANVLQVVIVDPTPVKDLPRLSGVSKEAIAMARGHLERIDCLVREKLPAPARGEQVRLTEKGLKAKVKYLKLNEQIEEGWRSRFSAKSVDQLQEALFAIARDGTAGSSPLFKGLQPYANCWRAKVSRPATLPHYPMVLHRGGYPDGS